MNKKIIETAKNLIEAKLNYRPSTESIIEVFENSYCKEEDYLSVIKNSFVESDNDSLYDNSWGDFEQGNFC